MEVFKLGGSLSTDPLLPHWLALLGELGGGRVVVVPGGGRFADEVRNAQAHWRFDDLAAHNMAVLAMTQMAYLFHALEPRLSLAHSESELRTALERGKGALWLPLALQRRHVDARTHWQASADTIALDLACSLGAAGLVLVKSCAIAQDASLETLSEAGIIDRPLASLARDAGMATAVLNKADLPLVRAMLRGEAPFPSR
jgi:5-(aminomethyl)-3-furanmethanol phosphate kinase